MGTIDFSHTSVEMRGISKKFGDFLANDGIDLTVHRGEVHALLGENGAGKTTLMNILYGIISPTSGTIAINGKELSITNPNVAINHGVGMVHQHFMLVDTFTVTENIVLGNEPAGPLGVLDMEQARREVLELSKRYGLLVDPDAQVQDLSVGSQQRVEILKTLYRGAEILILDEPTAVLTPTEIQELAGIIRNLTEDGKSVIIITHKLHEIKQMADHCTIIRKGRHIDTVNVAEVSEADLAARMVGREVTFKVEKKVSTPGDVVLEVKGLHVLDGRGVMAVSGLNLELRKGEILGIAGVDGNGQSELIEALTGLRKVESGSILMRGQEISNLTPARIIADHRIAHIPEDRQKRGLVFEFDIAENMVLQRYNTSAFSKGFTLLWDRIYENGSELTKRFDVRPGDPTMPAKALSGGNQQKMIIAREVSHEPELLIAAQPTRGLDVGAIEYVHQSLVAQRDEGKAVLLISFELDEVLHVADRIAVIYEGRIVGILEAEGVDENQVGLLMAGGTA